MEWQLLVIPDRLELHRNFKLENFMTQETLRPPTRRPMPRFSLASFLLLTTVALLGFSHFLTSQKLAKANRELNEYRFQHGDLVVDDPSRPHFLRFVDQQDPWKWYAHFPKEKKYRIFYGLGTVPKDGIPNPASLIQQGTFDIEGTGELMTFTVETAEKDDFITFNVGTSQANAGTAFAKKDVPWIGSGQSTSFAIGYQKPFVAEQNKPFLIFWNRKPKVTGTMVTIEPAPTDGIVVWAEPVK